MEETLTQIHNEEHKGMSSSSEERKKKIRRCASGWLRQHKVLDLVRQNRRLVEVPYNATLAATVNALVANDIAAVPVAAPPGRYIGAGGSMILESDPATGAVRKHYIGMITMLDVLVHIADGDPAGIDDVDLDGKMAVPVSSVIGHSLEGLSLWTLNPNTSILDCIETLSKGVHRALVPVLSQTDSATVLELFETSPGYRMLTQMDFLRFLQENVTELKEIMTCSVAELDAVNENIFAVTKSTKVIDAIRSMRTYSLSAVPVIADVAIDPPYSVEDNILQDGRGRLLIDSFSATDLRGCSLAKLQSLLNVSLIDFKEEVSPIRATGTLDEPRLKLITCHYDTKIDEVIRRVVSGHVHRVWVVDSNGLLRGLVSLTDMLRAIRDKLLKTQNELQEVVL